MPSKPDMTYAWGESAVLKTEPADAKKQAGWVQEKPPVEWMNWLQNRMDTFLQHINERGVPAWDTATTYLDGAYAYGSDNKMYESKVAANQGNDPTSSPTEWKGAGLAIKSLQRGTISIAPGLAVNTATVSAVDVSKSLLSFLGSTTSVVGTQGLAHLILTNSTTITAQLAVVTGGTTTTSYELIEYE